MFDPIEVFDHFVKQDIVQSLNNILDDPRLPRSIRNGVGGLRNKLRNGTITLDQFADAYEHGTAANM